MVSTVVSKWCEMDFVHPQHEWDKPPTNCEAVFVRSIPRGFLPNQAEKGTLKERHAQIADPQWTYIPTGMLRSTRGSRKIHTYVGVLFLEGSPFVGASNKNGPPYYVPKREKGKKQEKEERANSARLAAFKKRAFARKAPARGGHRADGAGLPGGEPCLVEVGAKGLVSLSHSPSSETGLEN